MIIQVDYAAEPNKARDVLLKAVRKYQSSETNSEFISKRWEYFKENHTDSNGECFQLAMLWASVSNTIPATFWLLFYILCDERVRSRVQEEVKLANMISAESRANAAATGAGAGAGAGVESKGALLTQESLDKMVYVDACITETLRLVSGSLLMRHVKEPTEITMDSGKKYQLRKGSLG